MANISAFPLSSAQKTADTGFTAKYNKLVGKGGNLHYHKSLDFSDVGIPTNGDSTAETNKHLRQFHQTRIYVENFGNMNAHGKSSTANESQTYLISANLPETLSYKIGSSWDAPFNDLQANGKVNALMQFASTPIANAMGKDNWVSSGVNRMGTMKVWNGSEPLSLNLSIPVIDDGHGPGQGSVGINTNFVEALEFLGSLCLPKNSGQLGFYIPPPSPVNLNIKLTDNTGVNAQSTYGRIMVQLGGMLLVDHCIITGINVRYPNTKTMIRHYYDTNTGVAGSKASGTDYLVPLLAFVDISITTVEAMTSDYYSRMLWLKTDEEEAGGKHTGMGSGNVDISGIGNAVAAGVQKVAQWTGIGQEEAN